MYTSDAKMMCVRAYMRLKSLGVSKSTINRWVACNPVSRRRREAQKATNAAIKRILEVLETNPPDGTVAQGQVENVGYNLGRSEEWVVFQDLSDVIDGLCGNSPGLSLPLNNRVGLMKHRWHEWWEDAWFNIFAYKRMGLNDLVDAMCPILNCDCCKRSAIEKTTEPTRLSHTFQCTHLERLPSSPPPCCR